MKRHAHLFRKLALAAALFPVVQAGAQQLSYLKQYASSGPNTAGQALIQTRDGNIVMAGTQSSPTAVPGQFNADAYLVKVRPNGDTIWTRRYDRNLEREYVNDIIELEDGRLVIVGLITEPPAYNRASGFLIMTDSLGNSTMHTGYMSASDQQEIHAIKSDGTHLYLAGTAEDATGNSDALLLKVAMDGTPVWSRKFGGSQFDDSWDVELTPDGSCLLTGGSYSFRSGTSHDDAWVVKVSADGQQQWVRNYGVADEIDWAWKLAPVKEGGAVTGYVFAGIRRLRNGQPSCSDIHFVKIDLAGNQVWDKSIPCPGNGEGIQGMDVAQLRDGGFVIAAYKRTGGSQLIYTLKTDAAGNVTWSDVQGAASADREYYPRRLLLTDDGACYVTGSAETIGQPVRHFFLLKYEDMQPALSTERLIKKNGHIAVFPNPASGGLIHVQSQNGEPLESVELISADGKVVRHLQPAATQVAVPTTSLPGGLYSLRIRTGQQVTVHRIVIQQ